MLCAPLAAHAQDYPQRTIRMLVSIAPGGAPDIVARLLADKLGPALGQPMVVENRTGANGNIAADAVAKARPDGHTLLLGQDSIFVINPYLYKNLPLNARRELMPVATIASNTFVLAANAAIPAKTFSEFIEHARRANPPLRYASAGNGSAHHLAMEMLKQRAGIELTHVPYRSGAPATLAILAGEVDVMFAGTSNAQQIKAGKLRALAVTGAARSDLYPGVTTIGESYPGFEVTIWLGVFAPAATPPAVITRLRQEIGKTLVLPEVKERLQAAGGLHPLLLSPEEFTALIERDATKYQAIVRQQGIALD
jgi:tripartite-type tricarboxylate transporter receptor subunit TctC